jgi:release factor glutamine methyltransferase
VYLHRAKIELSEEHLSTTMRLQEIKNIFHQELDTDYGKEEVSSFFYLLIEHFLKLERFVLAIQPDLNISKEEEQPLFEALSKLKLQQPIQYVLGTSHFMDMEFLVNENVLIPRPETEELVRWILEEVQNGKSEVRGQISEVRNKKSLRILDIGTGSGCIAIALAKYLPKAKVFALDISEKALTIAKENATLNDVPITFLQEDILKTHLEKEFDIIVSNPPYVRHLEKKEMHDNVLNHEPHAALFVPDDNPLKFYKAIAVFAGKHLDNGGRLFLEINQYLAKETEALLKDHNFSEIELRKDIFDKDRMIRASLT